MSSWRSRVKWRPGWRFGSSIRARVLTMVLIPSATLFVTGGVAAGLLISEGISETDYSHVIDQATGRIVAYQNALQTERALSVRAVGGDQQAGSALAAVRKATDDAQNQALASNTQAVQSRMNAVGSFEAELAQLLGRLPVVRQSIDLRQISASDADAYYTQVAGDIIGAGLDVTAQTTSDPRSGPELVIATDLVRMTDTHARILALATAGLTQGGVLTPDARLTQARLAGAYRTQLDTVVPRLTSSERAQFQALVASDAWRTALAGEDSLAARGTLTVPLADWAAAEDHVSSVLQNIWGDHLRYAASLIKDAASTTLWRSILVGVAVLVLSVAAAVIAARLANGLVRRLRSLRTKTLELAQETLPSMVRRVNEGEQVDVEQELAFTDSGTDELGQVAEAFNTAQRTAIEAAAAEARTRGGINKVFLNIAHRSQVVVHRQLEVLDQAEAKQNDSEHLELLFQLDHLATRARRNAENLLILGGGQPGRKWRNPVGLEEIVRSAISETEGFARVSAVRLPEVKVLGAVVADLVHLLAELVDNATVFSPPDAPVVVRGNLVGKGVVVEVEDQGLGIEFDERERLNGALRNPPAFQEMALAGQRNLGLFVIGQLAKRHDIAVSLRESAYGGITAIVLIPAKLLETDQPASTPSEDDGPEPRRRRQQQPANFLPAPVEDPVPRPRAKDADERNLWPAEEPAEPPRAPAESPRTPARFGGIEDATAAPSRPASHQRKPLPRRQRQAHLVPQLQPDTPGQHSGTAGSTRRLRSPDEARDSMSSFQRGTRQARDAREDR